MFLSHCPITILLRHFRLKRLIFDRKLVKNYSQFASTAADARRNISRQYSTKDGIDDSEITADNNFHYLPANKSDIGHGARVTLLSKDMQRENLMAVYSVSEVGFRLVDSSFLFGPIALFPKTALSWRVLAPEEITPESLELFFLLQPKLDVLLVGAGEMKNVDMVRKAVAPTIAKHRIGYEILDTENAASIFNFLNDEHRYVGAALLPPREIHVRAEEYANVLRQYHEAELWDNETRSMNIISLIDSLTASERDDTDVRSACYRIWGIRSEKAEEMIEKIINLREANDERRIGRLKKKIERGRKERYLENEKRVQKEIAEREQSSISQIKSKENGIEKEEEKKEEK